MLAAFVTDPVSSVLHHGLNHMGLIRTAVLTLASFFAILLSHQHAELARHATRLGESSRASVQNAATSFFNPFTVI